MSRALVALGSNLGDRGKTLDGAIARLEQSAGVRVLKQSPILHTAPVGGPEGQGEFLNQAILLETSLEPWTLLQKLHEVERHFGRHREIRWDARTLDLDLLLYDDAMMRRDGFEIPHPRMAFRRFVLEPAAAIAPEMVHPVIGWTMATLLKHIARRPILLALVGGTLAQRASVAKFIASSGPGRIAVADPCPMWHTDSPVPDLARAIESHQARENVISRALSHKSGESGASVVVTDFWLEQTARETLAVLPARDREAFTLTAVAGFSSDNLPHLVIDLGGPIGGEESMSDVSKDELSERSGPRGKGPVLSLVGMDDASRRKEILAAIEAM